MRLEARQIACYVHAGSSSEYGDNASGRMRIPRWPEQRLRGIEDRDSNLIHFSEKRSNIPCANLRLYSVYGPLEDSSRLIPNVVERARGQVSASS